MRTFDRQLTLEVLQAIAEAAGWKCGLLEARAIGMGRCEIQVEAL